MFWLFWQIIGVGLGLAAICLVAFLIVVASVTAKLMLKNLRSEAAASWKRASMPLRIISAVAFSMFAFVVLDILYITVTP